MARVPIYIDDDLRAALKSLAASRRLKRIGALIEPMLERWYEKETGESVPRDARRKRA